LICSILLGTALSVELVCAQEGTVLNPSPNVQLTFSGYFLGVTATASITSQYPPAPPPSPPPSIVSSQPTASSSTSDPGFVEAWDITVTGTFSGNVLVEIHPTNNVPVSEMWQTDIVPGDVNHDGKVNLCDLVTITVALGSTPGSHRWNPNCDLNHDGKVNLQDLSIAIHNLGKTSTWTDITYASGQDSIGYYVIGVTNHFSVFGVR